MRVMLLALLIFMSGCDLQRLTVAFDKPVVELYKLALPFLGLLLIALLIITYWEGLSLFLIQ